MIIRVHYNKQQSKNGLPWTIHTSRVCLSAAHVSFIVPVETEEKPDRLKNPRYFLKCKGKIVWSGKNAKIV